ncbi:hypothetical protein [Ilumatobacter sp.]|uniref:hypothetical protein n=1 Tax=Ilumatobacter sp. TaxID=1967498 RepID=UPI003AF48017
MKTLAIVLSALAAGSAAVAPSDLLVADDVPAGLVEAAEPPTDLGFDEYAPLSPDATAHVDPDSSGAISMRAAVDVWTSDDDDVLLREVTRWATEADARAFVEQAVVVGTQDGLDRVDPPIEGAVAFLGADDGLWTRASAWQQGPYAMAIAHFGVFEGSDRIIDDATTALAARVTAVTGYEVVATDAGDPEDTSDAESGGGIAIGTVLLWIVVIGGVMWLIMRLRRRAAGDGREPGRPRDRPRGERPDIDDGVETDEPDVDDMIERARARGRAEREIEAIPDPTEPGWTPPDHD